MNLTTAGRTADAWGTNMSDNEDLQKQVQEKLAQCSRLLDECEKLAEEGGFEFSFDSPGSTYYPASMFSEQRAIECLVEDGGEDWDAEMSPEEREEAIEEMVDSIKADLPEYTEPGEWWMPSRNC